MMWGCYRSHPGLILGTLIFRDVHGHDPKVKCFKGSGHRAATPLIPSERAPKTMGGNVENHLIHGFHVEISGVKGGPGKESGGWGLGQSGAPW